MSTAHDDRARAWILVATMLVGVAALAFTLRLAPGDDLFLVAAFALAAVWGGGAWLAGARLVWDREREPRLVAMGGLIGLSLLALCLAAALVMARVPFLREPAESLLSHADHGALWPVLVLTVVNGVVEEMFFRGALYDALPIRVAVPLTTLAYAATTVGSGVALLVVAAVLIGVATALLRRWTGGLAAPVATHLVWSVGMLLFLPSALATGR